MFFIAFFSFSFEKKLNKLLILTSWEDILQFPRSPWPTTSILSTFLLFVPPLLIFPFLWHWPSFSFGSSPLFLGMDDICDHLDVSQGWSCSMPYHIVNKYDVSVCIDRIWKLVRFLGSNCWRRCDQVISEITHLQFNWNSLLLLSILFNTLQLLDLAQSIYFIMLAQVEVIYLRIKHIDLAL